MLANAHGLLVGLAVPVIVVYLFPTWLAIARKHHWIPRIFIVNVLLGWTLIGWGVALHMALTSRTRTQAYWRAGQSPAGAVTSFVPQAAVVATSTDDNSASAEPH